jgi:hypothetical protein
MKLITLSSSSSTTTTNRSVASKHRHNKSPLHSRNSHSLSYLKAIPIPDHSISSLSHAQLQSAHHHVISTPSIVNVNHPVTSKGVIGDINSREVHANAAVSSSNLSSQQLQQLQQRQQLHYQTNAHVHNNNNNNQDNTRNIFSTTNGSSSSLYASTPSSLSANTMSTTKSLSANDGKYGAQPRRYSSFEKRLLSAMDQ